MDEEEINKLPESSDEDESVPASKSIAPTLPTPGSTQSSQRKRPLATSNANRRVSKRMKKSEEEPQEQTEVTESQPVERDMPDWLSQPSQPSQRAKGKRYGSKNTYTSALQSPTPTPKKKSMHTNIEDRLSSPATPGTKRPKKAQGTLPASKPPSPFPKQTLKSLEVFDDNVPGSFNENAMHASREDVFDTETHAKPRRNSSSSLSSVDSLASMDLDQENKDAILAGAETVAPRCPVCKKPISNAMLKRFKTDYAYQPARAGPNFCQEHNLSEAILSSIEKGYPELDFGNLATSKELKNQIKALSTIIRRKQSSFYLRALDDAIAEAKGNQTKINHYFNSTSLTTIHHGYYGPRGAKVVSDAIAEDKDVIKALKKAVEGDKAFRTAGVARIVDCVLLPEVLTRLVVEDMKLASGRGARSGKAEKEARKILEESADIGLILHPDEDEVLAKDEDDFV